VIAAIATLAAQVILTNTLDADGYGVVTVITQALFVLSFATRAGMDMAVLRDVAVEAGVGGWDRIKTPVARAALVAGIVSTVVALAVYAGADAVRSLFSIPDEHGDMVVEVAAIGLPFLALTNVWLSATRGLKIMRYTLYVFWAGQPVLWVLLMIVGFRLDDTARVGVLSYSLSWVLAMLAALYFWRRESRGWDAKPLEPGAMTKLIRYAGPRAPAALFSQLLFWTDLFVLTRYASDTEVGVYSAALRAGQVLVLFLTSVSLMFSPFVADLHNRGERDRLDRLFKTLTRWTMAATLPLFLVLAVAPDTALRIFGSEFAGGQTALLILLAGQFVNISTGSVGFILIMVGRTGWDLVVYACSLVVSLTLAFILCPRYGLEGAAIANAVTFGLSNLARLVLVRRFVNISPYEKDYARLVAPTAIAFGLMWLVHRMVEGSWWADLAVTTVTGVVVFVGALLAVGLTDKERAGLSALAAKFRNRPA
jgi:O-antigen/teichoic acid export membrane protein